LFSLPERAELFRENWANSLNRIVFVSGREGGWQRSKAEVRIRRIGPRAGPVAWRHSHLFNRELAGRGQIYVMGSNGARSDRFAGGRRAP